MKKLLSLVLAMAMTASLVACGNGGSSDPGKSEAEPSPGTTQQEVANQGTVDTKIEADMTYKKEIVVASHGASNKIDPQTGSSFNNTTLYQMAYDRLAYYNPTTQ